MFSPYRQHKTTFICCSLARKPPKAAIHCSCIVTYDVIFCARDKCGRTNRQTNKQTNKQTNRRGKRKSILVPAVRALRALRLVKTIDGYQLCINRKFRLRIVVAPMMVSYQPTTTTVKHAYRHSAFQVLQQHSG